MLTIASDAERVDSTAFYDFLGPNTYDTVTEMCAWRGPQDIAAILENLDLRDKVTADVGCGSGAVGAFLKSAGAAHVVGIDGSLKMLSGALANKHIDAMAQCNVVKQHFSFPDNTFDVSASSGLIPYLSDPSLLIAEMVRTTKPGGYIAASFHPSASNEVKCELLPAGSMNGESIHAVCRTALPNYHHPEHSVSERFTNAGANIIRVQNNHRGLMRVVDNRWIPLTTMLFRKTCSI